MSLPRLPTIDSLRGFLLLLMTINHLPGPHRDYTFDKIGYFTVAEGFVFISGLIAGLHGYDVLLRRGEAALRQVFYRRARTLYLSQLGLLGLLWGCGWAVIAIGHSLQATGHASPLWAGYAEAWANLLHPLVIDPPWAAGAALTLCYQPPLFDVLPMYCLFLFFTPFFLIQIARGRRHWLLLGSFLLWIAAQTHVSAGLLTAFPERWYIHDFVFDPLGWQILFIGGVVIGGSFLKEQWTWRPSNRDLALVLVLFGLGLFVRYAPVSLDWKIFLGQASYRGTLAPARLVSCSIIIACVGCWALRYPAWFTAAPLIQLGRNSLWIFLFQIALIYLVDYWCDQILLQPGGTWLDLLAITLVTTTLWPAARLFDKIRARQKAKTRAQAPLPLGPVPEPIPAENERR